MDNNYFETCYGCYKSIDRFEYPMFYDPDKGESLCIFCFRKMKEEKDANIPL